jgi:Methylamine utilisation protein MauE
MLDPVIGILIVASIALLFASAAIHKLRDPHRFDEVFSAYGLLPPAVGLRVSWAIPVLELGAALGLLMNRVRTLAGAAGVVLLLGYAAAMAVNLHRGRADIACGCGGADERRPIAAWMAWRNLALALLLTTALWPWNARTLQLTDALTIAFGLAVTVAIYLCLDRLGQVARRTRELQGLP